DSALTPNMRVTVSIRPEDVELSETAGDASGPQNLTSGLVDQKVFLGDFVDFQVKIGDFILLSRAHPSLRTPIGEKIHVRMNPDKCVAIPDDGAARAAA
ncbi:MAG: TOBE domain-containing protein, partial [Beijerinckiaceae bacterium]|nr:TOBE domain-containing protein [Beijerinckiaceae bacterium]